MRISKLFTPTNLYEVVYIIRVQAPSLLIRRKKLMFGRCIRALQFVRTVTISAIVLIVVVLLRTGDLAAQRPSSTTVQTPELEPPDFLGSWALKGGHGFDEKVACGGVKDPFGSPMVRCSQPWDKVKDYLNKRAMAWMEFRDEAISMKHFCGSNTLP